MESLAALIQRSGHLPLEDAVGWAIRLAKRVEELHRLGVAHGGLSADCVLVEAPQPTGKGIFADVRQSAPRFEYHSPERHQGRGLSQSDDTWAAAVTLYYAVTGQLPWPGASAAEVKRKQSAGPASPIGALGIDDDELQGVLDSFLARNVSQRVVRIAALREALEKWHGLPHLRELFSLDELEDTREADDDGGDEDDEDVKTVMRDFSEVRKQMKALSAQPGAAAGAPSPAGKAAPRGPGAAGAPGAAPSAPPAGARGPRLAPASSPFKSTAVGIGLADAVAAARATPVPAAPASPAAPVAARTTMPMPAMPAPRAGGAPAAPAGPAGVGVPRVPATRTAVMPTTAGPAAGPLSRPNPVPRAAGAPPARPVPSAPARPVPSAPTAPLARPETAAPAPQVLHVPATPAGAVAPGLPSLVGEDDSQDGIHTYVMDTSGKMPAGVAEVVALARASALMPEAHPAPPPAAAPAPPLPAPEVTAPQVPVAASAEVPSFGSGGPPPRATPVPLAPHTPSAGVPAAPVAPAFDAAPVVAPFAPPYEAAPPAPAIAGPAAPRMQTPGAAYAPAPAAAAAMAAPMQTFTAPTAPMPGAIPGTQIQGMLPQQAPVAPGPDPLRRWLWILLVVFLLVAAGVTVLGLRHLGVLAF